MCKINIHVVKQFYPLDQLNIIYNRIDIIRHDNIDEIFICDNNNIPMITRDNLLNYEEKIFNYLSKSLKHKIIYFIPYEGTNTVIYQLRKRNIEQFIYTGQIHIISSGDFSSNIQYANLDCFIKLVSNNYNTLVTVNDFNSIFSTTNKPYNFLYLNKSPRRYRTKLIKLLKTQNLLKDALWSNIIENIKLSDEYDPIEIYLKRKTLQASDIEKFNFPLNSINPDNYNDSIIHTKMYQDTYFSLICETNVDHPYSYRTEKIYKPILAGHPFIVYSNTGFYRDLRNVGFQTFETIIDESFDDICDDYLRMNYLVKSLKNLLSTNLDDFLIKAKPICEHNRNVLLEKNGKLQLEQYNSLTKFFNNICQN